MNFNENLQNLRKINNVSQEELAEKLDVSRQAISKWESGTGYPEMDKLLKICEIFDCSLDLLMKGKIVEDTSHEKEIYEKFYNELSKGMAIAVGTILLGITIFMILLSMTGIFNIDMDQMGIVGVIVVLLSVCISIPIFIVWGVKREQFKKKHSQMPQIYSEDEIEKFNSKYSMLNSIGVVLIIFGIILLIALYGMNCVDENSTIPVAILLGCITVAVMDFIYCGIQKGKYSTKKHKVELKESKIGRVCAIIMMISVMIFFVTGIVFNMWRFCWLALPIGGMLCAIAAMTLKR